MKMNVTENNNGSCISAQPPALVNKLLDEREVLMTNRGPLFKQRTPDPSMKPAEKVKHKPLVLLVEDSITTRTQERLILEGAGYNVVEAINGVDGLNKFASSPVDAVVTEITMPHMDGLTMTARIREDKKNQDLPIILVTMLSSDEDKRKGLEAGANAYITKSQFEQRVLIDTLRRLV